MEKVQAKDTTSNSTIMELNRMKTGDSMVSSAIPQMKFGHIIDDLTSQNTIMEKQGTNVFNDL